MRQPSTQPSPHPLWNTPGWRRVSPCMATSEAAQSRSGKRVAMLGTNCKGPRCISLEGEVGSEVKCTIYEQRSSPCREFEASWVDGQVNTDCDAARAAFGLLPLLFEL